MISFVARRLGAAILLLFLVLSATFFVLHLAPGDPTAMLRHPRVPAAQRLELQALWGLDQPLPVQYLRWIGNVLRGDWGTSFRHHRPATEVILQALPGTLILGGAALLIQLFAGISLGVLAAKRAGSRLDHALRVASLTLYALPTFWLALMALLLFTYQWPVFPSSHLQSVSAPTLGFAARFLDRLHHLALPALVLGLSSAGGWVRYVRSGLLEVLNQDYLVALRARGIPEWRILWVHALRASLGPLFQVLGFTLPFLLSGALIVEVLFSWPGLGQVTYGALVGRDYPLLLACTAWSATLVILGSLVADILQALADPRIREQVS